MNLRTRKLVNRIVNRRNVQRGATAFIVLVMLLTVFALLSRWNQIRIDSPEEARILLQQEVDAAEDLSGTVANVRIHPEVCTPVTGGNSCSREVQFDLVSEAGSVTVHDGNCSYGMNSPRLCTIDR
jgi:hypothetical protein